MKFIGGLFVSFPIFLKGFGIFPQLFRWNSSGTSPRPLPIAQFCVMPFSCVSERLVALPHFSHPQGPPGCSVRGVFEACGSLASAVSWLRSLLQSPLDPLFPISWLSPVRKIVTPPSAVSPGRRAPPWKKAGSAHRESQQGLSSSGSSPLPRGQRPPHEAHASSALPAAPPKSPVCADRENRGYRGPFLFSGRLDAVTSSSSACSCTNPKTRRSPAAPGLFDLLVVWSSCESLGTQLCCKVSVGFSVPDQLLGPLFQGVLREPEQRDHRQCGCLPPAPLSL